MPLSVQGVPVAASVPPLEPLVEASVPPELPDEDPLELPLPDEDPLELPLPDEDPLELLSPSPPSDTLPGLVSPEPPQPTAIAIPTLATISAFETFT
jgi:hypothetical protein